MVMTRLRRWLRHALHGNLQRRRAFPDSTLRAITEAVAAAESRHPGEIRFAVEAALPLPLLWCEVSARERAIAVFAREHVWDTEHNNGVLIYLLLADREVHIVADRGVGDGRVDPAEWTACCRIMEAHFRQGRFREGALAGIDAVAEVLRRHPPGRADIGNELPDAPILL